MRKALLRLCVLFVLVGSCAAQTQTPRTKDLAGIWEGTLGTGTVQLHLILTISMGASGAYTGELNSKDQHAVLSIENITFNGNAVRFEVGRVGGVYVGTISNGGAEITGTWTQTGVPAQPLLFKRKVAVPAAKESTTKNPTDSLAVVPIDTYVPTPPIAFKADGRWNLAYELRISNLADRGDATITRIDVLDSNHKSIGSLSDDTLKASLDPKALVGTKLGPRTFTTIYMWVSSNSLEEISPALLHRVTLQPSDEPREITTETPVVPLDRKRVIVISPPLHGDDWLAANGPSNTSIHRRAILPVNGRAFIGQKFAIDWFQVYPDGGAYRGDNLDNKSYRCYGQPIYAVADGVVSEVKDGIPENTPGPLSRAVEMTFETLAGNYVIERIGDGLYATFAHLQPRSVRVKLGDHVRRGQVLGLLGNSGNSTAPHLHFQICDANSVLACEGLPYAFSSFEVEGRWKPGDPIVKHQMEIPTEGEVVRFGTGMSSTSTK